MHYKRQLICSACLVLICHRLHMTILQHGCFKWQSLLFSFVVLSVINGQQQYLTLCEVPSVHLDSSFTSSSSWAHHFPVAPPCTCGHQCWALSFPGGWWWLWSCRIKVQFHITPHGRLLLAKWPLLSPGSSCYVWNLQLCSCTSSWFSCLTWQNTSSTKSERDESKSKTGSCKGLGCRLTRLLWQCCASHLPWNCSGTSWVPDSQVMSEVPGITFPSTRKELGGLWSQKGWSNDRQVSIS